MNQDLFNRVIAAHAQPKKGFAQLTNHNEIDVRGKQLAYLKRKAEANFQHSRTSLLGAQRFSVSNQMLDHAIAASLAKPERLIDMLATAIPCFDNMWLEWDVHHYMKMARWLNEGVRQEDLPDDHHEKDLSTWPTRAGFHFLRMNEENGIAPNFEYNLKLDGEHMGEHDFAVMSYSVEESGKIATSKMALCLNFSLDLPIKDHAANASFFLNKVVQPLLGEGYTKKHSGDQTSFKKISDAISFIGSPLDLCLNGQPYLMTKNGDDNIAPFFEATVGFFGQTLRTLIATLALLNYPHIVIQRDLPKVNGGSLYLGRKLPKNELKVLEIDLPKPRGTTHYERMFKGHGSKKRQHVRRGHWRTLRMKSGEIKHTWIKECLAGNPELGRVIHDYHLISKPRKEEEECMASLSMA